VIRLAVFLTALQALSAAAARLESYSSKLAPLIDPAKLATLGERGANPRVQKAVAILAEAEADKVDPCAVCESGNQAGADEVCGR
jgi:hypothetical protein